MVRQFRIIFKYLSENCKPTRTHNHYIKIQFMANIKLQSQLSIIMNNFFQIIIHCFAKPLSVHPLSINFKKNHNKAYTYVYRQILVNKMSSFSVWLVFLAVSLNMHIKDNGTISVMKSLGWP